MIETGISGLNVEKIMEQSEEEAEKQYIGTASTAEFDTPSRYDFKIKDSYIIDDFLQYYDVAFLDNAYWAIMGRAPDEAGMLENLKQLRSGKATRTDILMALRFSEEGKAKNTKIIGIEEAPSKQRFCNIPIVGSIINSLYTRYLFHRQVNQRLNRLEAQLGKLYYQDSVLRDVVNQKCDRSAAEYLRLRLKNKVERSEPEKNRSDRSKAE